MKTILIFLMIVWYIIIGVSGAFGQSPIDDAIALINKGELDQAWEIAYQLEMEQDYQDALTILNTILEKYPQDRNRVNLMAEKATIYEKTGRLSEAVGTYKKLMTEEPSSYEDHPYYSYSDFARLRIVYLTSQPTWTRQTRELLFQELSLAFSSKNLDQIKSLLKRGDCLIGPMYSEPDLADSNAIFLYLKNSLDNPNWKVNKPIEIWDGQWALEIENWKDNHWPDYDLLYLAVNKGLFGWEWGEIIFSKSEWTTHLPDGSNE